MKQALDIAKKFAVIQPYLAYLFGLAIIGVFIYTGIAINDAFNPPVVLDASSTAGKVIFDKTALNAVSALNKPTVVPKSTTNSNPFGQ